MSVSGRPTTSGLWSDQCMYLLQCDGGGERAADYQWPVVPAVYVSAAVLQCVGVSERAADYQRPVVPAVYVSVAVWR